LGILNNNNAISSAGYLQWDKVAKLFKVEWLGYSPLPAFFPTILKTYFNNNPNYPHFVVQLDTLNIVDPYDGKIKKLNTKIAGYRNIKLKGETMPTGKIMFFKTSKAPVYKFEHILDPNQVPWDKVKTGELTTYKFGNKVLAHMSVDLMNYFDLPYVYKDTLVSEAKLKEKDCSKEILKAFEEGAKSVECPPCEIKSIDKFKTKELVLEVLKRNWESIKAFWSKIIEYFKGLKK